ncbi:MAG: SAM-dependent methyltransferase [Acidobacteriota bacterium]|nr:MAG: SAM-dependent methyltransferase [Acidobacteriota bacterium]
MSGAASSTPASGEIRRRIIARGRIPFAEFMALALYHAEHGYYTRPGATTGPRGDYSTSSDVSPAFGRRLAVQAGEVASRLGEGPWRLVELGPGRGLAAIDMLDGLDRYAPDERSRLLEVVLIEPSDSLAAAQVARIAAAHPEVRVVRHRSLAQLPDSSVRGFVLANEVLDALPVHTVIRRREGLAESYVTTGESGQLLLCEGPLSDRRLGTLVERYRLCRRPGERAEISLELEPLIAELARAVAAGSALFIDYGLDAEQLADETRAARGTLVAYYRHRVEDDLLARAGEQDLTAHVNWTHFDDAALAAGWQIAGRTSQDKLLLALGLMDDLLARPGRRTAREEMRRLAARALIMPGSGAGKRFQASLLVKQIGADLRGLRPIT